MHSASCHILNSMCPLLSLLRCPCCCVAAGFPATLYPISQTRPSLLMPLTARARWRWITSSAPSAALAAAATTTTWCCVTGLAAAPSTSAACPHAWWRLTSQRMRAGCAQPATQRCVQQCKAVSSVWHVCKFLANSTASIYMHKQCVQPPIAAPVQ